MSPTPQVSTKTDQQNTNHQQEVATQKGGAQQAQTAGGSQQTQGGVGTQQGQQCNCEAKCATQTSTNNLMEIINEIVNDKVNDRIDDINSTGDAEKFCTTWTLFVMALFVAVFS